MTNRRGVSEAITYALLIVVSVIIAGAVAYAIIKAVNTADGPQVVEVVAYRTVVSSTRALYSVNLKLACEGASNVVLRHATVVTPSGEVLLDFEPAGSGYTASYGGYTAYATVTPSECAGTYEGVVSVTLSGPGAGAGELVMLEIEVGGDVVVIRVPGNVVAG